MKSVNRAGDGLRYEVCGQTLLGDAEREQRKYI